MRPESQEPISTEKVKMLARDWVAFCLASPTLAAAPYIDAPVDLDPRFENILPLRESTSAAETAMWRDALEDQLRLSPENRSVRFAALHPFVAAAGNSPYRETSNGKSRERWVGMRRAFRHIAALLIADRLDNLLDIKFELFNLHLAAKWELAAEVFRRASHFLPESELCVLQAHFYFFSVFGPRIEWELFDEGNSGYTFFWPNDVQGFDRSNLDFKSLRSFIAFEHPDILKFDSPAAQAAVTWSINVRAPVEIPQFAYSELSDELLDEEPDTPDGTSGEEGQNGKRKQVTSYDLMRDFVDKEYRCFRLIEPYVLNERQRERLVRALHWLRDGVDLDEEACRPYLPLRARALFVLGRFKEAAEAYGELEDADRFSPTVFSELGYGDWEWSLRMNRCLCLRKTGEHDTAIKLLEEFRGRRPIADGVAWWIAQWYSEQGRYHDAAKWLREELESDFAPRESWQLSTILALETVAQDQKDWGSRAREFLAATPMLDRALRSVISELWPTFSALSKESAERWLGAEWMRSMQTKEFERSLEASVVREYAWVVEYELKSRVFCRFREELKKSRELFEQATKDWYKNIKFLTQKDEVFTLGDMLAAFKDTQVSNEKTDLEFARYLERSAPRFKEAYADVLKTLKTVSQLRNMESHPNPNQADVREMARACRKVLDCFCEPPVVA